MTSKIHIGVIGAGSIAKLAHIPGLQKVAGVEVVAVCDSNEARAKELADSFGIRATYGDWRVMIADGGLDGVTIGTPNALHAEMAIAAFDAGLHVFCEKPLATQISDGEAMLAAAERAGTVFAVNMHSRERPDIRAVREAVLGGRLGEVRYANGRWFRRAGIPGYGSWFTRRELSGGGVMMDIGVHILDAILWILAFPKVKGVRGEMQSIHGPKGRGLGGWGVERATEGVFDVEDFAAIHLRLADGGLVSVEVAWAVYGRDEMRIQLAGSEGGADLFGELYGYRSPVRFFSDEGGVENELVPELSELRGSAWDAAAAAFIGAVRGERPPGCTGREALEVLRILDAAYRSAEQGCEVTP